MSDSSISDPRDPRFEDPSNPNFTEDQLPGRDPWPTLDEQELIERQEHYGEDIFEQPDPGEVLTKMVLDAEKAQQLREMAEAMASAFGPAEEMTDKSAEPPDDEGKLKDWYSVGRWLSEMDFAQDYRYDSPRLGWYRWADGNHWTPEEGELPPSLRRAIRERRQELYPQLAAVSVQKESKSGKMYPVLQLTEKNLTQQLREIGDGLADGLARPMPDYQSDQAAREWRRNHLAVPSGVVNLVTGEIAPHSPDFDTTAVTVGDYRPDDLVQLRGLLAGRLWPVLAESFDEFCDLLGIAFSGRAQSWRSLWFFVGGSNSGKGGTVRLMSMALGRRAKTISAAYLEQVYNNIDTTRYWMMYDQPLVIHFDELDGDLRINLGKLLSLTGDNLLPAARLPYMKRDLTDTIPSAVICTMVEPPNLRGDTGLLRRIYPLPFSGQIPEEQRDPRDWYEQDLLDAVVTVGIAGAIAQNSGAARPPDADDGLLSRITRQADPMGTWLSDLDPSWDGRLVADALEEYRKDSGDRSYSATKFGRRISNHKRWGKERESAGENRFRQVLRYLG